MITKLSPSQALNRPIIRHEQVDGFDEKETTIRHLGFSIGNLGLLIARQATSELSEVLQICPIPFTAAWVLGLINLRGNLVPVFDLHKLLQLPTQEKEVDKQMLLILDKGPATCAIQIDGLPIHLTFTDNDELTTLPPLPTVIKPYISSGYEKEGKLWFNFEHQGFFKSLATQLAL
jgi:chemotaxis signal transduction protein